MPRLDAVEPGRGHRTEKSVRLRIPTTDAEEALRFCQSLAASLNLVQPAATRDPCGTDSSAEDLRAGAAEARIPTLSVVIPAYNEQENVPTLYERLTSVLSQRQETYELVFVDDGSRDRTTELLRGLAEQDARVVVVELARNFGHQIAVSAGLEYAQGEAVIVMDADLQDPPEVLPQFIDKWREGHNVVYAIRQNRKEGWLKRSAYAGFYRILRQVANFEIPLDSGDFCIMDRRVVDLLIEMPERNRFVRGIRSWVGLDQVGLAYERHARYAGIPKYSFRKLAYLALDGLVSFSYLPLRIITILGLGVSALSILLALVYTIVKLTIGLSPPGFATLVVAIFFLAGTQLITMGVMGEYVGRIFEEVKHRPLFVVRRVISRGHRCES